MPEPEEGNDAPEWVVATQQALGSLIKRPKLTAPLLMKPPFRFLHDVVSEVMRTHCFAVGLYNENEQDKAFVIKDRQSKLAYLAKICSVVELTLGRQLDMRPAKVLAGLEPEKTNFFLQALAQAATSGVTSGPFVNSFSWPGDAAAFERTLWESKRGIEMPALEVRPAACAAWAKQRPRGP